MFELLSDVFHDTWLMLPLLYITYCILERFERGQTSDDRLFFGLQKYGPIIGALIGLIPQCGFSILAAMLYIQNSITLGTLVSVFIATSDEAIPILISTPSMIPTLLPLLATKFILAVATGFIVDRVIFPKQKILLFDDMEEEDLEEGEYEESSNGVDCPCCYTQYPLPISALIRTLKIYVFVFVTSLVLGLLIDWIGIESLQKILLTDSIFQPILASIFGFIPNCAATVVLAQLYILKSLSFGSLVAGLATNAGMGLMVLFAYEANKKDIAKVIAILFVSASICGMLLQFIV
ncbi:MAG: putative manganese transporter [Bacillota bacterium]|nr:putative manganese transporter [Bacillota bacterium]